MKSEPDSKKKNYKGWILLVVGAMVLGLIIAGILEVMSGKNAAG
jgi:hypothetical protein